MSDDLIKRSDVYKAVDDWLAGRVPNLNIKDIPSADKHGEWVNARDGYDGHVKCTSCFKTYDWDSQAQYYNFCPNCGSRMGKGADDE